MGKFSIRKIGTCVNNINRYERMIALNLSDIKSEIEPFLPRMEGVSFGIQQTTDGLCAYFDEMEVPIGWLVELICKNTNLTFKDIKNISI